MPPEHHETQTSAEIVRVEGVTRRRECALARSGATLCGDRARRGREVQARMRFGPVRRNPLRRSCVSRARNAGESAFWICLAQPSAEIVRVEGAKRRRDCVLDWSPHFWRKSCTKRWLWRLGASLLEEVLYETLALETRRFTFGGNLIRNARFGDLALDFWRKSRAKRWFWRFLALHFWRKYRTKRSFWRFGASLLEEVSYETLLLEIWRFTFGGSLVRNAHFGDLALHLWSWT